MKYDRVFQKQGPVDTIWERSGFKAQKPSFDNPLLFYTRYCMTDMYKEIFSHCSLTAFLLQFQNVNICELIVICWLLLLVTDTSSFNIYVQALGSRHTCKLDYWKKKKEVQLSF